jgi:hypothetical protein
MEFFGNLIDLCPVGALTSKTHTFISRDWELERIESLDILDVMGNTLYFYTRSSYNLKVGSLIWDKVLILKVLPKINYSLNNYWISDKSRFFFDSIYRNRLYSWGFYIKNNLNNLLNYSSLYLILCFFYIIIFNSYKIYFFNYNSINYINILKKYLNSYNNFFISIVLEKIKLQELKNLK